MAGNKPRSANQARRRPRRRRGVSVSLVVSLIILSLIMGAAGGYLFARKTDVHLRELQEANERIMDLENKLTFIGYPLDEDVDPTEWMYDREASDSAFSELSGDWGDEEDDLWADDSLLEGTLPEDTDPVVVAEFDGGQLLSTEVIPEYNDQLTTQIFAGYSAEEVAESTMDTVLSYLVSDKLIQARATEMGLMELNEEDLAAIDQEAASLFEAQLDDYMSFVGNGGESREEAAQRMAEETGVSLESITEDLRQTWWAQKYYDAVVADVTVSDEEVQAYYEQALAEQRQTFTTYPEEFEYAHMTGETILYRPEGYRAVRDIRVPFASDADAENALRLTEQLESGTASDTAAQELDALYAPLEATCEQAQAKLAAGTSFEELMTEYGCDEAISEEPLRSEGYYITDTSYVNSAEYIEGAMMLEQPGQVSSPLRSASGLHLVQYIGDVPAGEVPLSEVWDQMREDALRDKQMDYYEAHRQSLLEGAHVKYYPERLR